MKEVAEMEEGIEITGESSHSKGHKKKTKGEDSTEESSSTKETASEPAPKETSKVKFLIRRRCYMEA